MTPTPNRLLPYLDYCCRVGLADTWYALMDYGVTREQLFSLVVERCGLQLLAEDRLDDFTAQVAAIPPAAFDSLIDWR